MERPCCRNAIGGHDLFAKMFVEGEGRCGQITGGRRDPKQVEITLEFPVFAGIAVNGIENHIETDLSATDGDRKIIRFHH